jgi:hypothetical protein
MELRNGFILKIYSFAGHYRKKGNRYGCSLSGSHLMGVPRIVVRSQDYPISGIQLDWETGLIGY